MSLLTFISAKVLKRRSQGLFKVDNGYNFFGEGFLGICRFTEESEDLELGRVFRARVELADLFLDLCVSPDLRYKVLDEEGLEIALRKGWITEQLYEKAKRELKELINNVKQRKIPPYQVKHVETKLCL